MHHVTFTFGLWVRGVLTIPFQPNPAQASVANSSGPSAVPTLTGSRRRTRLYLRTVFLSPVVALLLHFLFVAQSAPISWFQPPAVFTEASERAKTLLEKILRDIPAVHAATIRIQVNNAPDWPPLINSHWLFFSVYW